MFFAPRHSRVRCRRSPIHGISAGDEAASARHQQGAPNYNPALYIHGVVNQEIAGLTAESSAKPSKRAALDPTNASPVKLYGSGSTAPLPVPYESMVPKAIKDAFHAWSSEVMNQSVHVHSKVVVIDPFGKKPVVITGSHNLHGPQDNATWQDSYLKAGGADLAEIKFWLGEGASAPAAPASPRRRPRSRASRPQPGPRRTRAQPIRVDEAQRRRLRRRRERPRSQGAPRRKGFCEEARPRKKERPCEEGARAKEWRSSESETARRQACPQGSVANLVTVSQSTSAPQNSPGCG
jgi:hypothetical protein